MISEKRVQSTMKYIQDKFNIQDDRMEVKGGGIKKSIADNRTKEGRSKKGEWSLKSFNKWIGPSLKESRY